MKDKEFMNQKVSELSVTELAEAIKLKVLRTEKSEVEVGDTVKILVDWKDGTNNSNRVGKIGELIELTEVGDYLYRVRLKDGGCPKVHKVEKIESKTEDRKTLSDKIVYEHYHKEKINAHIFVTDIKQFIKDVKTDCIGVPEQIVTMQENYDHDYLKVGFEAGVKFTLSHLDKRAGESLIK